MSEMSEVLERSLVVSRVVSEKWWFLTNLVFRIPHCIQKKPGEPLSGTETRCSGSADAGHGGVDMVVGARGMGTGGWYDP